MWILPKQLHTSAYVPGMEALISDSNEQSLACEQSLLARSKPSPARTWLQRWKRDTWTRHLSGRMLKPSHTPAFTERWTSSLEAILVSPSAPPASDSAQMIPDTYGPSSQMELLQCDQNGVSLKTSRDISRWGCPTSSRTWQEWVTELRGEYSQRVKLVRVTNAGEYSSLPTPCANEDSFRLNGSSQQSKTLEAKARRGELRTTGCATPVERVSLRAANVTILNLNVLPVENGPTHSCTSPTLTDAPNAENYSPLGPITQRGPLAPSFVEVMMGLPVGWTDCVSSETELSPPPQNEPSQL